VAWDGKLQSIHNALGTHTRVARVQGGKLRTKREIRIANLFREAPPEFLRMIVAHELAHLKEPEHDKAFYQLCCRIEPAYHQLEFDVRVWLCWWRQRGRCCGRRRARTRRRGEAAAAYRARLPFSLSSSLAPRPLTLSSSSTCLNGRAATMAAATVLGRPLTAASSASLAVLIETLPASALGRLSGGLLAAASWPAWRGRQARLRQPGGFGGPADGQREVGEVAGHVAGGGPFAQQQGDVPGAGGAGGQRQVEARCASLLAGQAAELAAASCTPSGLPLV
jgi:hypothetical protein